MSAWLNFIGDSSKPPRSRIERYKLQNALLRQIPSGIIQLGKKIVRLVESEGGIRLELNDGSTAGPFDLVVGADGIRSVSRAATWLTAGCPSTRLSRAQATLYRQGRLPRSHTAGQGGAHSQSPSCISVLAHAKDSRVHLCTRQRVVRNSYSSYRIGGTWE